MNKELIINEIKKAISGKDEVIEKVLLCIVAGGHIIMEDKPGVGKTTLAKTFSKVLDLKNSRIQFTNDLMPSDVTGYMTYNIDSKKTELKKGPIFDTNILLADEINRASAKSQSALLEVMEERQTTLNNQTFKMEDPFVVIATMNPYTSPLYGVSVLPQSQLDRFMMSLTIGYPSQEKEVEMLKVRAIDDPINHLNCVCQKQEIIEARDKANQVHVDESIYQYIVELANASRINPDIEIGISPRGELAIMKLAKTKAYFEGRNYVIPEDVEYVFVDSCIHRITLKDNELVIISDTRKKLLEDILKSVSKPKIVKEV